MGYRLASGLVGSGLVALRLGSGLVEHRLGKAWRSGLVNLGLIAVG